MYEQPYSQKIVSENFLFPVVVKINVVLGLFEFRYKSKNSSQKQ